MKEFASSRKKLPIGIDDFKDLRKSNGYFVDKSLFIKQIIDDISKVKLITRPRRFGKTLNLSMLRYFFEKNQEDTGQLFRNLKISEEASEYMSCQGQYPVIYLTFKDIKETNFDHCFINIKIQLAEEFKRHDYILNSDKIRDADKKLFLDVINERASYVHYKNSLKLISRLLFEYYDSTQVIILIDEYDTPINTGYLQNYYKEIINFMRGFLAGGLKGNSYLEQAVITGIYRVAKESIFSGFNNLKVCSVIENFYADKFGFTEKEVEKIMTYYNSSENIDEVKNWYNGYVFGDSHVIYNPWSILNYIENSKLKPYWANTSNNNLIRSAFNRTDSNFKKKLFRLMEGNALEDVQINTDTNFQDIQNKRVINDGILWNLLLVSGYLNQQKMKLKNGRTKCDLKIANREVYLLFEDIINNWFESDEVSAIRIQQLLNELVSGDIEYFKEDFEKIVRETFSYFDVGVDAAENFYHAFILGLLVNLDEGYRIKSNTESGKGRPDIIIIPEDNSKNGVIIEFKVSASEDDAIMEEIADQALSQIDNRNYIDELIFSGINEIIEIAIVLYRKKAFIDYELIDNN